MAETFHVSILAADKAFYEGECESLVIPTSNGQYGILANHCNLLGAIVPGMLEYKLPDAEPKLASVSSGIFKMEDNKLIILIDSIERPEEIDANRAKEQLIKAQEALLQKMSRQEYYSTQIRLARAMNRIQIKSDFDKNKL